MSGIKTEFKRIYGETMKNLGFKYANGVFYRTINDVVQVLQLKITRYDVYIHYGIFPLCRPIYFDSWPQNPQCHFSWYREIRDGVKRDVKELMEATFKTVSKKVIPAFETGIDTKSAYEINRHQWNSIFHNQDLTWMALKNRDYENAYLHLSAIFAQNIGLVRANTNLPELAASHEVREKFENWTETEEAALREQVQEEVDQFYSRSREAKKDFAFNSLLISRKNKEERIRKFCDMLARINQRDDEYFQKCIEENERAFLAFLEKVEENPRKNWA